MVVPTKRDTREISSRSVSPWPSPTGPCFLAALRGGWISILATNQHRGKSCPPANVPGSPLLSVTAQWKGTSLENSSCSHELKGSHHENWGFRRGRLS